MKRCDRILKQAAVLTLAALLCFVEAGCGCNQAMEESSSSPGVGPSAGAAAGDSSDTPATSSTDGINQMTTPEHGTTTANGAEDKDGPTQGSAGSSGTEDLTHSAGAVGGGTAEGDDAGTYEENSQDGAGFAETAATGPSTEGTQPEGGQ